MTVNTTKSPKNTGNRPFAMATTAAAGAVFIALSGHAHASTISATINTGGAFSPTNQSTDGVTYFNANNSGPFPAAPVTIGELDYTIPGSETVSGATISGNFGSNIVGSATAPVDLFLNGIEVASCDAACAMASQSNDVAWSFTFGSANLFALATGKAILTAVQQGPFQIALDPSDITIQTTPVPLPGGLLLLTSGIASLFGFRRRLSDVGLSR